MQSNATTFLKPRIIDVQNLSPTHAKVIMEPFERGNHFFKVLDVLPMNNEIYSECDAALADLTFADPPGQFDLVRVCACSGNPVRRAFARILKAELDMVKARFHKLGQTLARKPDSRRDQVRVQTRLACACDQLTQIRTRQRLASGEVQMQNAERGGLAENAQPVGSRELFLARSQLQRIRAVHAVQRAAVRDLGNQGQRIRHYQSSLVIPSEARDLQFAASCRSLASLGMTNSISFFVANSIINDSLGVQLLQKYLDLGADLALRRQHELRFQLLHNFS